MREGMNPKTDCTTSSLRLNAYFARKGVPGQMPWPRNGLPGVATASVGVLLSIFWSPAIKALLFRRGVCAQCESIHLRLAPDCDQLDVWQLEDAAPIAVAASNDKQVSMTNLFHGPLVWKRFASRVLLRCTADLQRSQPTVGVNMIGSACIYITCLSQPPNDEVISVYKNTRYSTVCLQKTSLLPPSK